MNSINQVTQIPPNGITILAMVMADGAIMN
jgi:hypothetical protein